MRGFACPKCGERAEVYRTRKPAHEIVVRYRKCKGCGYRVTTEERRVAMPHASIGNVSRSIPFTGPSPQ